MTNDANTIIDMTNDANTIIDKIQKIKELKEQLLRIIEIKNNTMWWHGGQPIKLVDYLPYDNGLAMSYMNDEVELEEEIYALEYSLGDEKEIKDKPFKSLSSRLKCKNMN
jgi:hypothetical protein